jgi:hypothetical protein
MSRIRNAAKKQANFQISSHDPFSQKGFVSVSDPDPVDLVLIGRPENVFILIVKSKKKYWYCCEMNEDSKAV